MAPAHLGTRKLPISLSVLLFLSGLAAASQQYPNTFDCVAPCDTSLHSNDVRSDPSSKNTREIHPEDSSRLANDVPDQGSSKQNTEPRMISPAKSSAERSFVSYYYIIVNETALDRDARYYLSPYQTSSIHDLIVYFLPGPIAYWAQKKELMRMETQQLLANYPPVPFDLLPPMPWEIRHKKTVIINDGVRIFEIADLTEGNRLRHLPLAPAPSTINPGDSNQNKGPSVRVSYMETTQENAFSRSFFKEKQLEKGPNGRFRRLPNRESVHPFHYRNPWRPLQNIEALAANKGASMKPLKLKKRPAVSLPPSGFRPPSPRSHQLYRLTAIQKPPAWLTSHKKQLRTEEGRFQAKALPAPLKRFSVTPEMLKEEQSILERILKDLQKHDDLVKRNGANTGWNPVMMSRPLAPLPGRSIAFRRQAGKQPRRRTIVSSLPVTGVPLRTIVSSLPVTGGSLRTIVRSLPVTGGPLVDSERAALTTSRVRISEKPAEPHTSSTTPFPWHPPDVTSAEAEEIIRKAAAEVKSDKFGVTVEKGEKIALKTSWRGRETVTQRVTHQETQNIEYEAETTTAAPAPLPFTQLVTLPPRKYIFVTPTPHTTTERTNTRRPWVTEGNDLEPQTEKPWELRDGEATKSQSTEAVHQNLGNELQESLDNLLQSIQSPETIGMPILSSRQSLSESFPDEAILQSANYFTDKLSNTTRNPDGQIKSTSNEIDIRKVRALTQLTDEDVEGLRTKFKKEGDMDELEAAMFRGMELMAARTPPAGTTTPVPLPQDLDSSQDKSESSIESSNFFSTPDLQPGTHRGSRDPRDILDPSIQKEYDYPDISRKQELSPEFNSYTETSATSTTPINTLPPRVWRFIPPSTMTTRSRVTYSTEFSTTFSPTSEFQTTAISRSPQYSDGVLRRFATTDGEMDHHSGGTENLRTPQSLNSFWNSPDFKDLGESKNANQASEPNSSDASIRTQRTELVTLSELQRPLLELPSRDLSPLPLTASGTTSLSPPLSQVVPKPNEVSNQASSSVTSQPRFTESINSFSYTTSTRAPETQPTSSLSRKLASSAMPTASLAYSVETEMDTQQADALARKLQSSQHPQQFSTAASVAPYFNQVVSVQQELGPGSSKPTTWGSQSQLLDESYWAKRSDQLLQSPTTKEGQISVPENEI